MLSVTPIRMVHLVGDILAALICALLAVYAARRRGVAGARPFAWMMGLGTWMSLGNFVASVAPTLTLARIIHNVAFAALVGAPIPWLLFALVYTGHESWVTPRRIALLCIVPLLTQIAILDQSPP